MHLFDELQDSTFELYAIRHYYNPRCVDAEEFYEDLKRFKYIKRLITRYNDLLLNHLIVVFNVFGVDAGLRMLEFKIQSEDDWSIIKPFLIYLRHIENTKYASTPMDPRIVEELRKI